MKSKLFLMISALFVAFMLLNSAMAQQGGSGRVKPEVRSDKVYLPCDANHTDVIEPYSYDSYFILKFEMTNNTAAWLAEGKTIHFSGQGTVGNETIHFAINEKKTLDVMIPPKGSVILFEKKRSKIAGPGWGVYGPPFNCQAWFFK